MIVAAFVAASALALGATSGQPVQGPLAVMPFKNLNGDASIEWMRVGIAETMVSDLKKRSTLQIVEREQVDKAITELLLQGEKGAEISTAARVGKLIGAKTVVLGAYQRSKDQLRITARFITVETGEVLDTAKTTGPITEIFLLQDQIVARLLGQRWTQPALPKAVARKAPRKRLKAYRLYAMALTSGSDADRLGYLNQSIEEDPEFSYALEDLARLKDRLRGYRHAAEQAIEKQRAELTGSVDDPAVSPPDRATKAQLLFGQLLSQQRHSDVIALGQKILARPEQFASPHYDLREAAGVYLFNAQVALKHDEAALKTGEAWLEQYPGSPMFRVVEMQMQNLIREHEDLPKREKDAAERLARLERERAEELARVPKDAAPPRAAARLYDFSRCTEMNFAGVPERAIEECEAFFARWVGDADPQADIQLAVALLNQATNHARLGRFAKAQELGRELLEGYPKHAHDWNVEYLINHAWSAR